jgi:hypothetical protein
VGNFDERQWGISASAVKDPPLQQNVGYVRVGDKAGDELALQIQCPLSLSDNACQPAIWLR